MKFIIANLLFATASASPMLGLKDEHFKPPKFVAPDPYLVLNEHRNLQTAPCFTDWELWTPGGCNVDALLELMDAEMPSWGCAGFDAETELQNLFGVSSMAEVEAQVQAVCTQAYQDYEEDYMVEYADIMKRGPVYDKAYFDGGTDQNDMRQNKDNHEMTDDHQWAWPNARIVSAYYEKAKYNAGIRISPVSNFEECELDTVMCCWSKDRQAGDDNGNCAEPYDENCVDADPADNTDICYVDMERSPDSNNVGGGFAVYPGESEGDTHCHGFAWPATRQDDEEFVFRGNKLFYVSQYDHLSQRGYAKEIPGSPMCACVEKMATVSRADCTEIDVVEQWVGYSVVGGVMSAYVSYTEIEFNACQGAGGNNNDLAAYFEQLVNDGLQTEENYKALTGTYVVGDEPNNCNQATAGFLSEKFGLDVNADTIGKLDK
eukprot:CAMPEP_0194033796 /NCGR_PEP_ID=MMETSP0009_2-20130614/6331_1 /TAXON_ID=210454 /ORGANISM="Grammatophora oceanica, Strain CCMP 410" /LENGTH=431 /DNA_ID=CAMNT_0038674521 /DNA_START=96 /DNA_END=1391 /DNA_ORIENTATION=+